MNPESSAFLYAEREEFARALSLTRAEPNSERGIWQPWAYFRLGMYETVASLAIDPCDARYAERQLLPAILSHAALSRFASVHALLDTAPWGELPTSLRVAVAKHLSSYMPQEALRLLEGVDEDQVSATVRALIFLRAGCKDQARDVVRMALDRGEEGEYAGLHLYRTITEVMLPQQKLECFNQVYAAYGLPILALCCDDKPLSPLNVYSPGLHKFFDGPLVSVLMTTFNVAGRVSAAIGSILEQSYRHLELIVVDDCSSDDTFSEVMKWTQKDSRVCVLRLDCNVGTYCAKSIGLRYASGEFVTCMDADDWSHPLKLELQIVPLLKNQSLMATTSNCVRIFDDGVADTLESVDMVHINYSSLLFRREKVLPEIGGWDSCARTQADIEFMRRMDVVYGRGSTKNIPLLLSLVSRREDSLTVSADGTGFGGGKFPPEVLKYMEAFNKWHIEKLKMCVVPRMSDDPMVWVKEHPFMFPSSAFSDVRSVSAALIASYQIVRGHSIV